MSMPVSDQLVIRPCGQQYVKMLKATPVLFLVPVALLVFRQGTVGLIAAVATALISLGAVYIYLRAARVIVTPTEFGRVVIPGRVRLRPRSQIGSVVSAAIPLSPLDARIGGNLFVLGQDGSSLLRLRSTHWAEDDVRAVVERLGIQPTGPTGVVTAKEFRQLHPRALPWIERRPFLAAAVLSLGVFVAIIVIVLILAL